jgi:hypothetical protein
MNAVALVLVGEGQFQASRDDVHLALRLIEAHARLQASEGSQVPSIADLVGKVIGEWAIDFGHLIDQSDRKRAEAFGQDPDHQVGLSIQRDPAAHDGRLLAETPLPQTVTKDGNVSTVFELLPQQERPAQQRLGLHHAEESVGDAHAAQLGDVRGPGEGGHPRARVGRHVLEYLVLPEPRFYLGIAHLSAIDSALPLFAPDQHQAAGVRIGQAPQQHSVDSAENGASGADGQSQGKNRPQS